MDSTMKSYNIKLSNLILFAALLLYSCQGNKQDNQKSSVGGLPYYNEATFTPNWLATRSSMLDTFHTISSFQLMNQDGQMITEKTFDGKIYVTDFFFTSCPGICPKMTANMADIQEAFMNDNDVVLLSHSVTPENDSVPVLKEYAQEHGVQSGKWHLVTGTQKEIYKLGRKDYFVEEDLGLIVEEDEFLHTENFVLIDQNRHIRGIYNGLNKASIRQLIADINTLKKES